VAIPGNPGISVSWGARLGISGQGFRIVTFAPNGLEAEPEPLADILMDISLGPRVPA
jgi:hypothetical protein